MQQNTHSYDIFKVKEKKGDGKIINLKNTRNKSFYMWKETR